MGRPVTAKARSRVVPDDEFVPNTDKVFSVARSFVQKWGDRWTAEQRAEIRAALDKHDAPGS